MPNGRCRLHGGASLAGLASPTYKTGRYSKYLPGHLLEDFNAAKDDPELVQCRDEMALVDARMGQLAGRLQTGHDAEMWARLSMLFSELAGGFDLLLVNVEATSEDGETALKDTSGAIEACRAVISEVRESEATWHEMYALVERRRKLVETESKRLKEMSQTITAERAMLLVTALAASVKAHVRDADTIAAINRELIQLVGGAFNGNASVGRIEGA